MEPCKISDIQQFVCSNAEFSESNTRSGVAKWGTVKTMPTETRVYESESFIDSSTDASAR